jgi:O-Antigen ligase
MIIPGLALRASDALAKAGSTSGRNQMPGRTACSNGATMISDRLAATAAGTGSLGLAMSALENTPTTTGRNILVSLRRSPATVPALGALALFVVWSGNQGGYPITHWAPGGLIVLALLAMALVSVPLKVFEIPIAVRVALACLAAYTALSFLSALWAADPGQALEGADRTLLYLLVFALFALWRQRGSSAAVALGAWTIALIGMAVFVVLHLALTNSGLRAAIPGGRLVYPAGYVNADAAQWLMAFWPAVLLARSRQTPWALRGVLAGGSVLLADVALLSQSRGSVYATAAMLILVFALLPGRTRTFATLVPIAMAVGLTTPLVLRVGDRIQSGGDAHQAMRTAALAMFVAAVLIGLAIGFAAAIETRRSFTAESARRIQRAISKFALAALLALIGAGLVAFGNPVTKVRHGWESFKVGYGADSTSGNRLVSGLGSNRYDFYRVALDEFVAHPVGGIGADNFFQQYLAHGHSSETPRYPHSIELRTLAETGLLGALLAIVGLGAAMIAAVGALRSPDRLARSVAAAALAGFGYWLVHGSVDWLWEFAGLGAPAFALLGIVCALAPAPDGWRFRRLWVPSRTLVCSALVAVALCAAICLVGPWLSQVQVQEAARVWTYNPHEAYDRLNSAARLNPLSEEPYLVAGGIALRFGDLSHADEEFRLALKRTPTNTYATLERGAIASQTGHRDSALKLLARVVELDPRDRLARQALSVIKAGGRVSVEELNRSILLNAQQLA